MGLSCGALELAGGKSGRSGNRGGAGGGGDTGGLKPVGQKAAKINFPSNHSTLPLSYLLLAWLSHPLLLLPGLVWTLHFAQGFDFEM